MLKNDDRAEPRSHVYVCFDSDIRTLSQFFRSLASFVELRTVLTWTSSSFLYLAHRTTLSLRQSCPEPQLESIHHDPILYYGDGHEETWNAETRPRVCLGEWCSGEEPEGGMGMSGRGVNYTPVSFHKFPLNWSHIVDRPYDGLATSGSSFHKTGPRTPNALL